MKKRCCMIMILSISAGVWAIGIDPIPEESGLDGYINVGASWMKVESNSFAGPSFKTLSSKKNGSIFSSPDSEDGLGPMFGGEFRYTFADTRTQLFLGNAMQDMLQFDMNNAIGVRQELADESILEGAVLFTASPVEVWSDPFVTGVNRNETDRESSGGRITWWRMFGVGLQLSYSYRDIDIDNETSGQSLVGSVITAAQQPLLDRNGDHHRGDMMYVHQMNDNNWIAPRLRYDRYDLDGDAMANDRYGLLVTHVYASKKFKLVTNLSYATAEFDKRHPVYAKTRDDDQYGISTTLFYPNFMNNENLIGNIGVGYWVQDSNISFYDEEILAVTAGTMYTF